MDHLVAYLSDKVLHKFVLNFLEFEVFLDLANPYD